MGWVCHPKGQRAADLSVLPKGWLVASLKRFACYVVGSLGHSKAAQFLGKPIVFGGSAGKNSLGQMREAGGGVSSQN